MSNDKITEAYSEALESADVIPMTSEELFLLGWQAAVARQPESEPVEFTDYDPGAINDWGGGNVGWWQDYIRSEINRANDYWREQTGPDSLYTSPQPTPQVPEGFRKWLDAAVTIAGLAGISDDEIIITWPELPGRDFFRDYPQLNVGDMRALWNSFSAASIAEKREIDEAQALDRWADRFNDECESIPVGHENKSRGSCTYNWYRHFQHLMREEAKRLQRPGPPVSGGE